MWLLARRDVAQAAFRDSVPGPTRRIPAVRLLLGLNLELGHSIQRDVYVRMTRLIKSRNDYVISEFNHTSSDCAPV